MNTPPVHRVPDLPERLALLLRKDISDRHKPGDKIATIRALTKHYDVSINTMRAALSILAREGLIEMWQGSGIYVCDRKDERPVGILMEIDFSMPDVSYFWRRVTQQIRVQLAEVGIHSRLYAGFHRPGAAEGNPICPEFLEDVNHNRLKGVIVTHGDGKSDWVKTLCQQGAPVIGHWDAFENQVDFDLVTAVRIATSRLIEAGRRRLAFMDWGDSQLGPNSTDALYRTFAETLKKHGVPLNPAWVRGDFHPNMVGAGWEEFREIWTSSAEKPDGLVVADDVLFRGVARAITEFGIRVPEQLLVATHANRGAMEEYPFPMWRMVTDPDAAAGAQVDLMLKLLRHEPVAQPKVILPVQFVEPEELPPVTADSGRTTKPAATKQ